ncbi:hypothetical protein [uncultured Tenacibaculum sp.]|uniref:hypothetical protein n=1 Tax=uncultured Tenacibaculum sp. TaxID=174713 RepID=UPI00260DE469|nr:hypothetical protein [uncultured Tenacibaculum sp.]
MTENDLNNELEKLQSESVNNGGIWRFLKLPIPDNNNIKDYFKNTEKDVRLDSVLNSRTKELIMESIDHWSSYSGPCPERTKKSVNFDKLKVSFVNTLFAFVEKKEIIDLYRVENCDSWLNKVIESGIDHMNEDYIIQTNNGSYVLHLGFSS